MELRRLVHVALEEKADYLLGATASSQSLIAAITAIVSLKNLLFLNSPSQKKWFALCCRMEGLFFNICTPSMHVINTYRAYPIWVGSMICLFLVSLTILLFLLQFIVLKVWDCMVQVQFWNPCIVLIGCCFSEVTTSCGSSRSLCTDTSQLHQCIICKSILSRGGCPHGKHILASCSNMLKS